MSWLELASAIAAGTLAAELLGAWLRNRKPLPPLHRCASCQRERPVGVNCGDCDQVFCSDACFEEHPCPED